jgi:uncharacterized protein GlcG (DUF336 family)
MPSKPTQAQGGGAGLTPAEVNTILNQAQEEANGVRSALRGPGDQPTRMHIAVVARDGRLLGIRSMPDAWVGSLDIAVAKARTGAFFSSNQNALTSRVLGDLSEAHSGPNKESNEAGPLWGIWASNQQGISGGPQTRNGIITFPGGLPLYKNGQLVGGVGVSGDAVDPDEAVAFEGAAGFRPPAAIPQPGYVKPRVARFP